MIQPEEAFAVYEWMHGVYKSSGCKTIVEFAKQCDIAPNSMYAWMSGHNIPSRRLLEKFIAGSGATLPPEHWKALTKHWSEAYKSRLDRDAIADMIHATRPPKPKKKRSDTGSEHSNGSHSLCWDCRHAVPDASKGNGCIWSVSKCKVPVYGTGYNARGDIITCPLFEDDTKEWRPPKYIYDY